MPLLIIGSREDGWYNLPMRRSFAFWYYFFIAIIIFVAFSLGDFGQTNNVSRWLILALTTLLLLAPLFFAGERSSGSYLPPAPTPSTSTALADLAEAKRVNQQLEEQKRAVESKDLELTLANQRLQKLEQAKSQFVSVTAHQLRTPLSAIKWTFHMVLKGELGAITEEQKVFLQKGYDGAERVIMIVNDLLNIDHIETGQSEYTFIPVNINDWVGNIVAEFNDQAQSKNIKLEFIKADSLLPPAPIDPVRMSMVLENLIDNAIKYTSVGGRVGVVIKDAKINTAQNVVEIVISDSGIGIPPADQGQIFQRFFRSPNAIKISPDGSGLGLFVAKEIVDKHGGQLRFDSQENVGTQFHLTIPLRRNTR